MILPNINPWNLEPEQFHSPALFFEKNISDTMIISHLLSFQGICSAETESALMDQEKIDHWDFSEWICIG